MKQAHKIGLMAAAVGVPAAVLRAMEIQWGFDPQNGMPLELTAVRVVLWGAALLVLALAIVMSQPYAADNRSYEEMYANPSENRKITAVCGAALMLLGAISGIYVTFSTGALYSSVTGEFLPATAIPLMGLWLLAMASAASFVLQMRSRKQEITKSAANFTIIPLYWAAFDLIVTYKETSISPFITRYAMDLAVAACLMVAFYLHAGLLYGKPRLRCYSVFAALAIFFSVASFGEAVASIVQPNLYTIASADGICRCLCFVAASMWLMGDFPQQQTAEDRAANMQNAS